MADERRPSRAAALALHDAGIPVLVLRDAPDPASAGASPDAEMPAMQVLVPAASVRDAIRVLEPLPWRYSWARGRLTRLNPMVSCWWDGGAELEVHWACQAAPMPPRALSRLTHALWEGATPGPDGLLEPRSVARLVHLGVQACRPGHGHEVDWADLVRLSASIEDPSPVIRLARGVGVSGGVRRALDAARAGAPRPGPGLLYDGALGAAAWLMASAVQAHARPPRLRRLLAGTPALGDATIRARVAGTEVLAGPGVFVPTPDADLFVDMATRGLRATERPVVIEVGTGCGAIALAVAMARPDAEVHGTELFESAVRWARRSASRNGLERVRFHRGSLLEPLPASLHGRVDLIVANLPFYPAKGYASIGSVPRGTIQGSGDDGLGLLRRLVGDSAPFLRSGAQLLLQMFAWQWETFSAELESLGFRPGPARISGPFAICPAELRGAAPSPRIDD